uniref:Uncharacterized protein n=1 Tax=Octopus bimaculoides TaxID=37653 RepID=A0A0L8HN40_OCTBM
MVEVRAGKCTSKSRLNRLETGTLHVAERSSAFDSLPFMASDGQDCVRLDMSFFFGGCNEERREQLAALFKDIFSKLIFVKMEILKCSNENFAPKWGKFCLTD